jgi:hypothetical protein
MWPKPPETMGCTFLDILAPEQDRFAFLFRFAIPDFLTRNLTITRVKILKTLMWC